MSKPGDLYGRPWGEREYIIVLYYYLRHRDSPRHATSEFVKEIASLLGRTVGSVLMRLENYASLDPTLHRAGLVNIGPIGQRVFEKWFQFPDNLAACAEVLIRESRERSQPTLFDPDPIRVPKAFGKYELLDLIGEGACGSVYSCINTADQTLCALKIIRTDKIEDAEILGRFRREIRLLKSQRHRGVIRIYEDNLDELQSFPAFVMELATISLRSHIDVRTKGLGEQFDRPRLPLSEAVFILRSVFAAVSGFHEGDPVLIHRDINPNNVLLLPDGRWVLSDFSLGKFFQPPPLASTFVTETLQGWGTEPYAAPEQWRDFKRVDQRADIYALGVLVWDLLSPAWPPFDRSELQMPEAMRLVVLKATSRKREERHNTVKEFVHDFEDALQAGGRVEP